MTETVHLRQKERKHKAATRTGSCTAQYNTRQQFTLQNSSRQNIVVAKIKITHVGNQCKGMYFAVLVSHDSCSIEPNIKNDL